MKLLLHMCCAPCSTYSTGHFRRLGYDIHGYFYNPNIHPYKEFLRRRDALKEFCQNEDIPLDVSDSYDLEDYLHMVMEDMSSRCRYCYRIRLEEAAQQAAKMNIPWFSTTLAISPYQDHELLRLEGEEAGRKHGVSFIYEDLRPGYRESVEISRKLGIYRQPYCGCIFSEKERYLK
ncbi:MAG: epoxyqueuosine reductase QueH [Clostridiales bacterium]|nr:epoxyqueuosine reductase QueH [Clostridiales bacterium]